MFKKKPNIPPRPKPPIAEQVLDDLKNTSEDDVVFTLMKNNVEFAKLCGATHHITEDSPTTDNPNNPEAVYQKVKNFLEVSANLQSIMTRMHKQNKELFESDIEIKKMAEDIRRQAIDAVE
ncbi:hypothetical protein C0J52_02653 [Blattella germanica]|nr:hypothetical protein C0J52_02653 [Blattella germanica]